MTSLKKPLIAIAAAVALAGTMLFAGPANAASTTLTVAGASPATAGTASASAIALPVPSDNDVSSADAVRIALSGVTAGSNVTATATNAKIVTAVTSGSTIVKVESGVSTATIPTGTGTTADIYVYTTTTETGTVAVTANGNTTVYYVKGTAGPAYSLSASVPTVAGLGSDVDFTATVTDVFGNAVENASITTTLLRGTVKTALTWNSTDKLYKGVITTPATAGTVAGIANISATDVTGLPKAVKEVYFSIAAADLAAQVAILSAANAKLTADYNKLANRWNKKVDSKKKVFKKVTLK